MGHKRMAGDGWQVMEKAMVADSKQKGKQIEGGKRKTLLD
jgi:hypothetical protein